MELVFPQEVFTDVLCDFNHVPIEHIYGFSLGKIYTANCLLFFCSVQVSSEKSNPVRMGMYDYGYFISYPQCFSSCTVTFV